MHVEVLQVIRVEEEVTSAYAGDNVKLRLKGVEEEVGGWRGVGENCNDSLAISLLIGILKSTNHQMKNLTLVL